MRNLVLLAAVALASACGGGATAELNLHDAPPAGVTSVKITVASMDVHVVDKDKAGADSTTDASIDDDDSWRSLEVNKQIDLVPLQGESAATKLGELELPEGKITQIRLVIDVSKAENNTATKDGTVCNLDTSKVDTKGIKINHAFKAFESKDGSKIQTWVDFELDKSLTVKGDCFLLEPKLKLGKVKTDGTDTAI